MKLQEERNISIDVLWQFYPLNNNLFSTVCTKSSQKVDKNSTAFWTLRHICQSYLCINNKRTVIGIGILG